MGHRILFLDTYYPEFLNSWVVAEESSYDTELRRLLYFGFGTGDFYSRNLKKLGWETMDVIANYHALQTMWSREHGRGAIALQTILSDQIERFQPDVVFLQDLSFLNNAILDRLKGRRLLAGQCSCEMPHLEKVQQLDFIFTSFPHYVERFRSLGVKSCYLPLAFEPDVLSRFENVERDLDCVFVGGMGWQWNACLPLLEEVALSVPQMEFWGYGYDTLPSKSPIRKRYQGQIWGLDMYRLLSRAKIVLNRHGAVSEKYANNLRMFEICGAGAMLLTDEKSNLSDFFGPDECVVYSDCEDAVSKINFYLEHEVERELIASKGHQRCLRDHTYQTRMPTVDKVLRECLVNRK